MGNLPAGIERLVESIRKQKTDWVSVLWRFAQSVAKADFRWTRPNPRFLSSGLYLPGLRSEQMGAMVCVVDTSGSINDRILQTFGAEMTDIAEMVKPEKVFVVYCDAAVHRVDEYDVGEPITINPIGGGGTDFRPAFDWVAEQGIDTACLVFLTDMLGRYPEAPPEYPVLWATMNTTYQAPFGEIVPIEV
jgi:predicted metal-dependent peptidase